MRWPSPPAPLFALTIALQFLVIDNLLLRVENELRALVDRTN